MTMFEATVAKPLLLNRKLLVPDDAADGTAISLSGVAAPMGRGTN